MIEKVTLAPMITSEATQIITKTLLDYADGWYTGDAARMERSLHPDLAKRIVKAVDGQIILEQMAASVLVDVTQQGYGKDTPPEKRLKEIVFLDVFGNAASVKMIMSDWVDYLHLGRFDGQWLIVNVLWELNP